MNKAEYHHPEDEFDGVEPGSMPRGVHRSPMSWWRRAWPFLLVIVLFPVLAYGAVNYWSNVREAGPSTPSASASATQSASPSAPATTAAAPVLSTPVVVFNATSTGGLAAAAVTKLTDAGWTAATPADYTGGPLESSTARYTAPELEGTARAAAAALGITTVEQADGVESIEIVLEDDYTP